jgi:hypothetical protein
MITIPENQFTKPFLTSHRNLFVQVLTTTQTMHGWASPEKCCTLAALVLAVKPKLSLEIGVWGGRSLLPMAIAHKAVGGVVIGVDPWNAEESARDEFPDSAEWWAKQDHQKIFEYCQRMIKLVDVGKQVQLMRERSDDILPPGDIGVFHCDGSHMEAATRDAMRFCPNIIPGGYAVFDDIGWTGGAVLRALDWAEQNGFKEVYRVTENGENWCVMQHLPKLAAGGSPASV